MSPRRSQLGVLFLTVFVDLVGFSVIFPLFPAMLEHYLALEGKDSLIGSLVEWLEGFAGASDPETSRIYVTVLFGGVLGSLYSFLQFLFAPIWGSISDRTGRRPILLLTITGLTLSYALWIFAGSFALLIVSRFLGGLMSGNISVATAAVADSTDEKNRAKGMGAIGAAFGLGFILGPALGGWLSHYDLSGEGAAGGFGLNPFSAAAIGAFVLSLWNVIWVATRFQETLDEETRAEGRAHTARRPISPVRLFRGFEYAGVTRTNWTYFVYLIAFAGMEFTLTFLARERFAWTPRDMTWLFVFIGFLIVLVQGGVVRRIAPRVGEKRLVLVGLVIQIPGLVLVGLAQGSGMLYSGVGLLAVGSALAMPCLTSLVSLYTPRSRQGEVLGTFRSLGALSRAVGPILASLVFWRFGSAWTYHGAAALIAIPLFLALALPPPPGRETSAPANEDAADADAE